MALGFAHQALAFRIRESFDALPLDLRLLQHGRDQFPFAARDFRVLNLHLCFALYLLHSHGFGNHLLLHDVGLDFVGLVRSRLSLLRHLQDSWLS